MPASHHEAAGTLETLAYAASWITISSAVVIYNKWILTVLKFPYPIALTMAHMALNTIFATIGVWSGLVPLDKKSMSISAYIRGILPIAGLFSIVLWFGNTAYLYLSVSFIQMLKAIMPALVYVVSVSMGLTTFGAGKVLNILLICVGVAIASYGELLFNFTGFSLQITSSLAEALRLALLQILVQKLGLKLNPISTVYYIAPPCFLFLSVPFFLAELPQMVRATIVTARALKFIHSMGEKI